jgi:hypothetical protein
MPNLEEQISAWRDRMSRARLSLDALDELESHLRDDIARQLHSGVDAQQAFAIAAQRIGLPLALQKEFRKVATLSRFAARAKNAMLSFAGIPDHYLSMNNPSSNLNSRITTYLRSAVFLLPAVCLWVLAMVYVTPAFKSIWEGSADRASVGGLDNLLRFNLDIMYLFKDRLIYFVGFAIVVLALLEWRSRQWPRYRRAVIGAGVFLLNVAIVFSFAVMFLAATVLASQLVHHAK